jgi:hypothetical protein
VSGQDALDAATITRICRFLLCCIKIWPDAAWLQGRMRQQVILLRIR